MDEVFKKLSTETIEEYEERISSLMDDPDYDLTWTKVAIIINEETGNDYSADRYRKKYRNHSRIKEKEYVMNALNCSSEELDEFLENEEFGFDDLDQNKIEKIKLSDERNQINNMYRRICREETLKEIAHDISKRMNPIDFVVKDYDKLSCDESERAAILCLSDFHYGIEIESYFNKYNPDIAKERIQTLMDKTIKEITSRNITNLYIVNLGDLISGRIHQQIRINNRYDVITQIMHVSELLAQMISVLSKYANISYCDTLDNHSRVEKNISDSLDLESLSRLTKWYLKERLPEINYIENKYGDDIVSFNVLGHNVIGVHGHKDKQNKVIDSLTTMTQTHYDLILTAHMHHFSCDEKNGTLLICNSSLMGSDDYAIGLRLTSQPSQNLIIVGKDNPAEEILRILV